MFTRTAIAISALFLLATSARAQQGYEFEVYGADVPARSARELELNMNFVPSGSRMADNAQGRATHRAVRSSIGLSTGLLSWLEASLYAVTYARNGVGVQYAGNRARLTAAAPESWKLPFDAGLSQEIGYARPGFAENRWAYEFTPIFGKEMGSVSLLLNPAFERGLDAGQHAWELEPRARLAYPLGAMMRSVSSITRSSVLFPDLTREAISVISCLPQVEPSFPRALKRLLGSVVVSLRILIAGWSRRDSR